uniref:Uncharacterized protein n=1 Tax=Lotharella globosa TaxID=91324 RepID=A0A7S3Z0P8_9EUKA
MHSRRRAAALMASFAALALIIVAIISLKSAESQTNVLLGSHSVSCQAKSPPSSARINANIGRRRLARDTAMTVAGLHLFARPKLALARPTKKRQPSSPSKTVDVEDLPEGSSRRADEETMEEIYALRARVISAALLFRLFSGILPESKLVSDEAPWGLS